MEVKINNTHLELIQGDITDLSVDAIVNAANCQLILGGGVAGAIHRKGGPAIQSECNTQAPIEVGQAVMTTGGHLRARHVIHVVGPRMGQGDEDQKLRTATRSTLQLADQNGLETLAFCAVSTGIFGYPKDRCADVMLTETLAWLKGSTGLKKVIFCLYDASTCDLFGRRLERLL